MKAILIDPINRQVSQVETTGDLKDIYKHLNCSMIECPVTYPNGDTIYCDEEAWLTFKEEEPAEGWMFNGFSYAILGKAMIIGTDMNTGESKDAVTTTKAIESQIHWVTGQGMLRQGIAMGLV
jgi:hypothetical protein